MKKQIYEKDNDFPQSIVQMIYDLVHSINPFKSISSFDSKCKQAKETSIKQFTSLSIPNEDQRNSFKRQESKTEIKLRILRSQLENEKKKDHSENRTSRHIPQNIKYLNLKTNDSFDSSLNLNSKSKKRNFHHHTHQTLIGNIYDGIIEDVKDIGYFVKFQIQNNPKDDSSNNYLSGFLSKNDFNKNIPNNIIKEKMRLGHSIKVKVIGYKDNMIPFDN